MPSRRSLFPKLIILGGLSLITAMNLGCIGFTTHLFNVIQGGHKIKPDFTGLQGKRVAVVCVSNSSSYGPNTVCTMLARSVGSILQEEVKRIEVIHEDEVADWVDKNEWDQMDYREIGQGVDAEMVLAIDLDGFRLHEGRTLYKGNADVTITVYDMNDGGKVAFREEILDFSFPRTGARHTTEISEARFRRLFVTVLARNVAKHFHEYLYEDDFATDALSLGT
jgi:hypothetical protein